MGEPTGEGHRTPRNVRRQAKEGCGRPQKAVEGQGRRGQGPQGQKEDRVNGEDMAHSVSWIAKA